MTPMYKDFFLRKAEYISVRNPQDLRVLKHYGVRGDYFPDVAWQTADLFPMPPKTHGKIRIGIDLYLSGLARRQALHILPLLWSITKMRSECEFIFMDSTDARVRSYRGLGIVMRGSNIRRYQFSNLPADLEFLSSLDLLVSSRLHVPLVCMGYGVPIISTFCEKKTSILMKDLNLSDSEIGHGQLKYFRSLFAERARLEEFIGNFQARQRPSGK
jgi:hypothetical protein